MKSSLRSPLAGISGAFALALFAGMPTPAHALTWFDGSGIWDNTSLSWNGGTAAWSPNGAAVFSGGPDTVLIGDNLQIGSISLSTGNNYTFDNTVPGWTMDINGIGGPGIDASGGGSHLFMNAGTMNFNNSATVMGATIQIDSTSIVSFNDTSSAGTSTLNNNGTLEFNGASTTAGSAITNTGFLNFTGTSTGGATVVNSGNIDISGHTGGLTLASITNEFDDGFGPIPGGVDVGLNTLTLTGGLTLSSTPGNSLAFTLLSPLSLADGSIVIGTGGLFTGSTGVDDASTIITISGPATPGLNNQPFVLIDWSAPGAAATNVSLGDFQLSDPTLAMTGLQGYGYHLAILDGNKLVLVPEPATLAMPLAAALGMLTLRRRNKRQVS